MNITLETNFELEHVPLITFKFTVLIWLNVQLDLHTGQLYERINTMYCKSQLTL